MTLSSLISRVEEGEGRDRILERDIWIAMGWSYEKRGKDRKEWLYAPAGISWAGGYRRDHTDPVGWSIAGMDLSTSLDAVVSLIEKKLPGWAYAAISEKLRGCIGYVHNNEPAFAGMSSSPNPTRQWYESRSKSPARALLAAFLRAYHAQKEQG